ncbi:hypothetical protein V492_05128 [Pseudogymnoascus sp. VKM F-4246]|nr:hypothetical protein V492_05128 [Pseudogymnoascus sp. VKM F-4246]
MLRFIYQGDYDDEYETEHSGSNLQTSARKAPCLDFTASQSQISNRPRTKGEALLINIRVFSIAKKFGLDDLMSLAVKKHREAVKNLWNTPNFERSITLLYDKELGEVHSSKLRYATADIILSNIRELLKKQTFRLLLICHGDLATEVLLLMATEES